MHPNARLIEDLYSALRDADPTAAAACYNENAYFRDIAFSLRGRGNILRMWRLICARQVAVTVKSVEAKDWRGRAQWVASYTFADTGRNVTNNINSLFAFRNGLIVDHRDRCDALAWATQAYPFPRSLLAGFIGPLRRYMAGKKLEQFIRDNPGP
jgi:ketosteroid isomerase-like protein